MTSIRRNLSYNPKPLICIYTNQNRNEFAIGLEKDENFRTITKVGESYTRFVDAYDQMINDENELQRAVSIFDFFYSILYEWCNSSIENHQGERRNS